jgi:hypothetical protein
MGITTIYELAKDKFSVCKCRAELYSSLCNSQLSSPFSGMYVLHPGTYFYLGFSIHGPVRGSPFSGKYILHAGTYLYLESSIKSCLWVMSPNGSSAVKSFPVINACHVLCGAYEALLYSLYC